MLLIVALPDDPLGAEIAATARTRGQFVGIVSDFAAIRWELRIDRVGRAITTLTFGEPPTTVESIVYLGGTWFVDDGEFSANERLAAWWALLAAFPGPVVNRPTRHGLVFTLDRVRTRSTSDCRPFRWTLRNAWQARQHALIRAADGLHYVGTALPGEGFGVEDMVLEVTECTPARVQRFAVAGNRVIPIMPYHQTSEEFVEAVASTLVDDMPAIAVVVAEHTAPGMCTLLDIGPRPSVQTLGDALQAAVAGVLEAVQ